MNRITVLLLAAAMIVAGSSFGCVQIGGKEPLVKIGEGSSKPTTQFQSGDSDEVRALKDYAGTLEKKLAEQEKDARNDLDKEKDKRKKAEAQKDSMEEERNYWKKRAEQAEDQLKKLRR